MLGTVVVVGRVAVLLVEGCRGVDLVVVVEQDPQPFCRAVCGV